MLCAGPMIAGKGPGPQACFEDCPEDKESQEEKEVVPRDRKGGCTIGSHPVMIRIPASQCNLKGMKPEQVSSIGPTLSGGGVQPSGVQEMPSVLQQRCHHWGWGDLSGFQPRLALAILSLWLLCPLRNCLTLLTLKALLIAQSELSAHSFLHPWAACISSDVVCVFSLPPAL